MSDSLEDELQLEIDMLSMKCDKLEARIAKLLAALDEIANSTWVAQTCPEAAQIARKAREEDDKHGMATD